MILLSQVYAGYAAGTVVSLPTNVEQALIAQNRAVTSVGPVTPGPVVANISQGFAQSKLVQRSSAS